MNNITTNLIEKFKRIHDAFYAVGRGLSQFEEGEARCDFRIGALFGDCRLIVDVIVEDIGWSPEEETHQAKVFYDNLQTAFSDYFLYFFDRRHITEFFSPEEEEKGFYACEDDYDKVQDCVIISQSPLPLGRIDPKTNKPLGGVDAINIARNVIGDKLADMYKKAIDDPYVTSSAKSYLAITLFRNYFPPTDK